MTSIQIAARPAVQGPSFPPPSPDQAKVRDAEIEKLLGAVGNQVAQYGDKAGLLLQLSFVKAGDDGVFYGPWKLLMDSLVNSFRISAPAYGEALCKAVENVTITQAKAQKLIPADYTPPKA